MKRDAAAPPLAGVAGPPGPAKVPAMAIEGLDPQTLEKLRRGFPLHMDRQGNFSFEGDAITHPGIVALFRANLDATEGGEVTLGLEGKWVYLKLADLPLRALRVDRPRGDERAPHLILDDARRLPLDPATLWEEPDAGLRCTVPARDSGRPLAVRLLNAATMDLSNHMVWPEGEDDDARPELIVAGQRWAIPEAPPSSPPGSSSPSSPPG